MISSSVARPMTTASFMPLSPSLPPCLHPPTHILPLLIPLKGSGFKLLWEMGGGRGQEEWGVKTHVTGAGADQDGETETLSLEVLT